MFFQKLKSPLLMVSGNFLKLYTFSLFVYYLFLLGLSVFNLSNSTDQKRTVLKKILKNTKPIMWSFRSNIYSYLCFFYTFSEISGSSDIFLIYNFVQSAKYQINECNTKFYDSESENGRN